MRFLPAKAKGRLGSDMATNTISVKVWKRTLLLINTKSKAFLIRRTVEKLWARVETRWSRMVFLAIWIKTQVQGTMKATLLLLAISNTRWGLTLTEDVIIANIYSVLFISILFIASIYNTAHSSEQIRQEPWTWTIWENRLHE